MHSSIFNIFLGLLFQLNFYGFKGIDILPDVIGYYFIYKGLKELAEENKYFGIASKLVLPLMVLSLAKLYNFQYHQEILISFYSLLEITKIIIMALNIYLIFNLCKGAIEIAVSIKDEYLEKTIGQRLYLYLGVAGILLTLSIISLLPFAGVVAALQKVFTLILFVYLCVFIIMAAGIFSLYRQLAPKKAKPVKQNKPKTGGKASKSKHKR